MTQPDHREAATPDDPGALQHETPDPAADTTIAPEAPPAATPSHAEDSPAPPETAEHAAVPAPLPEAEPTAHHEAHEAEATPAGTPIPAAQLAGRVEALERQVEAAADRARHPGRVQALRKRVEEAAGEDREALLERLARLDALCLEHLALNLSCKEALVVHAEALCPSTDWKPAAEAIKALQAEWKTIGPVPQDRSQELWQRFRKAGNTFFERLQEHRKEQSQDYVENLRRKEELCGKAEEWSAATDWKNAAEAIKALQAEWKTIGPAPREQADAVWRRFRKAADVFFERRKEHSEQLRKEQEENLGRKEALVAKAEELSQSTQWKATVQAIKELQAEWRTVGPAPSHKAESVWRRFRSAIDLFFERQAAYFAQRQQPGAASQDPASRQDQLLDALERKREQANRVREGIDRDEDNLRRWRGSLAEVHAGDRADEIRSGLEAKIADVEAKLPARRQRLDELESSIREIAAKLA